MGLAAGGFGEAAVGSRVPRGCGCCNNGLVYLYTAVATVATATTVTTVTTDTDGLVYL